MTPQNGELELDTVRHISYLELIRAPENDKIYRPMSIDDPDIIELAAKITKNGIIDPLIFTQDNYIVSGHRRHMAAMLAGVYLLPCRRVNMLHNDPRFVPFAVACNSQRLKSSDEILREVVVQANPNAYQALCEHRLKASRVKIDFMAVAERKDRCKLSKAKSSMLDAMLEAIEKNKDFLPISERRIHYEFLHRNPRPLIHASKPDTTYGPKDWPASMSREEVIIEAKKWSLKCSQAISDVATRGRLEGLISMDAIADDTRPVCAWDNMHRTVGSFLKKSFDNLLVNYFRDYQQSQPNHLEICGEKNTIEGIIRPVAMQYLIPYTLGHGYCSLPPRFEMVQRFRKSGAERMIILMLADWDPDGLVIADSFVRSLRQDFHLSNVEAVKVTITHAHISEYGLCNPIPAKSTSKNYKPFHDQYGDDCYELEALDGADLQSILHKAIKSVINVAAFNHEIDQEKKDAEFLDITRQKIMRVLGNMTDLKGVES